ncbi:hypothetical protein D9M68_989360 [compost metagenome]
MIGGRQPGVDRESRRFHAESQQQQGRDTGHGGRVGSRGHPHDVGHVERAEQAIGQAQRQQEQRCGEEIEEAVFHRAIELQRPSAQHDEPE